MSGQASTPLGRPVSRWGPRLWRLFLKAWDGRPGGLWAVREASETHYGPWPPPGTHREARLRAAKHDGMEAASTHREARLPVSTRGLPGGEGTSIDLSLDLGGTGYSRGAFGHVLDPVPGSGNPCSFIYIYIYIYCPQPVIVNNQIMQITF